MIETFLYLVLGPPGCCVCALVVAMIIYMFRR